MILNIDDIAVCRVERGNEGSLILRERKKNKKRQEVSQVTREHFTVMHEANIKADQGKEARRLGRVTSCWLEIGGWPSSPKHWQDPALRVAIVVIQDHRSSR